MRRLQRLSVVGVVALLIPLGVDGSASAAPPAPRLPATLLEPDFTDTVISYGALATPISLTAIPGGRVIVLEKGGKVRVIQSGSLLATPALDLSAAPNSLAGCTGTERGLLGFAADPDFTANGFVYIYYTRANASAPGNCVNRVSRFQMTGNTIARASEVVLIDNISSLNGNHNGGDIEVGHDGFLYVAVGDGGCDPRNVALCHTDNESPQDLSLLNGKILRVDRFTGAPAPGNPFTGPGTAACRTRGNTAATPTTTCQEVFAYGLRNPWRFAFDPNTGATRFHINDVGELAREEVNLGIAGANYGWPAREGLCAAGEDAVNAVPACAPPDAGLGYTDPIIDYPHDHGVGGQYITGGAFVPNGAWPAKFDGGYLFADGYPGKIFLQPAVGPMETFATDVGGVADLEFVYEAGGWALYYVNAASNQVRRIRYDAPVAPDPGPLAFAAVTPQQRVFDSRNAGAHTGPLRAGSSRLINVATVVGDHRAALVNITTVLPSSIGYVSVSYPRAVPVPTSNLNGTGGQVIANASIVPIDSDGNIVLYSSARTHVIVDLLGFFDLTTGGAATAGRFQPVAPVRAADTRTASSAQNLYSETTIGATPVVNVPLAGRHGLANDVQFVCLMVTAIATSGPTPGFVVAHGHASAVPATSNLNVNGFNDVRANLVVVAVGADGSIDLRLKDVVDVLVDVIGSFTTGSAALASDGTYQPLAPVRIVDTRVSLGFPRFLPGTSGAIDPAAVPADALAVAQNVVITGTASNGYITTYPTGLAQVPAVSNGNASGPGQTRSVLSLTRVGAASVSYFTSMGTDVIVDVTGYFNGAV